MKVGELETLPDGRSRLVSSIEGWSDRVVVRWAEAPAADPGGRPRPPAWELSDDVGTEYQCSGSGGSGTSDLFFWRRALPARHSGRRHHDPDTNSGRAGS